MSDDRGAEFEIARDVAFPMRISTFAQGADAHFEVDRGAAERVYASLPLGVDAVRVMGDVTHGFLVRAVRYLAGEVGIDQFLVFGTQVAGRDNVHRIAREIDPGAKVVYVLTEPVMLVYAHRLVHDSPPGATAYFPAKLRDVDEVLSQAGATLDLSRPTAVVMNSVLGYVRNGERAQQIVDGLVAPLAAGSHLMATHHASDLLAALAAPVYRALDQLAAEGKGFALAPRTHTEVSGFFSALDLVDPGVVPVERWRPADSPAGLRVPFYGAIARKPTSRRP